MIRFVVAVIWIVAVTIGTIFLAYSATGNDGDDTQTTLIGKYDFLQTEIISIPVIRDREVQGYFLTRMVYAVEPEKAKALPLPIDVLLVDELYSYVYGNPHLDFANHGTLDLDAFRSGMRDSVNQRIGDDLVREVMVEQIDYLSKREVRDNALKRRDVKGGSKRPTLATGAD